MHTPYRIFSALVYKTISLSLPFLSTNLRNFSSYSSSSPLLSANASQKTSQSHYCFLSFNCFSSSKLSFTRQGTKETGMGKASRWFRSILGLKKTDSHHQPSSPKPSHKDKRRWSFVKSYREKGSSPTATNRHAAMSSSSNGNAKSPSQYGRQQLQRDSVSVVDTNGERQVVDPDKHAIAVAAATAAVAEAAVAAAQAAAAVVRLTSNSGRCARELPAHFSSSSSCGASEESAAIKIQSAFRGYLVRF